MKKIKNKAINGEIIIEDNTREFIYIREGEKPYKVFLRRAQLSFTRSMEAVEPKVSNLNSLIEKMENKVKQKDTKYFEGYIIVDNSGKPLINGGQETIVLWIRYNSGKITIVSNLDDFNTDNFIFSKEVHKEKNIIKKAKSTKSVTKKSSVRLEYEYLEELAYKQLGFKFDKKQMSYRAAVPLLKESIVAIRNLQKIFPTNQFPVIRKIELITRKIEINGVCYHFKKKEDYYKYASIGLNKFIQPGTVQNTIYHEYGHILWKIIQKTKPVHTSLLKFLKRSDLEQDKFIQKIPKECTSLQEFYQSKEFENMGPIQQYFLNIDEIGAHIFEFKLSKMLIKDWTPNYKVHIHFTDDAINQFVNMYLPIIAK